MICYTLSCHHMSMFDIYHVLFHCYVYVMREVNHKYFAFNTAIVFDPVIACKLQIGVIFEMPCMSPMGLTY